MPSQAKVVRQRRIRRHQRIRNRIHGSGQRPRLSVFRSSANTYAQIIDDGKGHTLAAASSLEADAAAGTKVEQARRVGELVAERARAAGIEAVVFDRGGFLYHGRVKAVADGARAGGLKF
jgi:large subunit ribosomal protein L18